MAVTISRTCRWLVLLKSSARSRIINRISPALFREETGVIFVEYILNPNRSLARLGSHVSYARMDRMKRVFADNLGFLIAGLTYAAANVIDYLLTIPGVENNSFQEGNLILRGYIEFFGAEHGILICKLLICIGVMSAMGVINLAHKKSQTWMRAEYILYGGAILMTLGGCLWLF